jgi:hypothetical protein
VVNAKEGGEVLTEKLVLIAVGSDPSVAVIV